jgi:Protein of unknown function (DUF2690)
VISPATASVAAAGAGVSGVSSEGVVKAEPALPRTTTIRADGTRIVSVDSAAIKALTAAAATSGCGSACDDLDADHWFTPAGGPSNWYRCSDDALTVREAYLPGGSDVKVELRYSPRCRTAWSRGPAWMDLVTNSYKKRNGVWVWRTETDAGLNPNADGLHWTRMVNDAGMLAEACMGLDNDDPYDCSGRY